MSSEVHPASGVYGTLGMASSSNIPGPRNYAASWIDSSGNLWLFGGQVSQSTAGTTTCYTFF